MSEGAAGLSRTFNTAGPRDCGVNEAFKKDSEAAVVLTFHDRRERCLDAINSDCEIRGWIMTRIYTIEASSAGGEGDMIDTAHGPIDTWDLTSVGGELGADEAHVWRASLDQPADV